MAPRAVGKNAKAVQDVAPRKSEGGSYTLKDIMVGAKLYAEKTTPESGETEQRQVEVLSIREERQNRLHLLQEMQEKGADNVEEKEPELHFYVHYCGFNKRLDEWIPSAKLVLSREMELSLIHI